MAQNLNEQKTISYAPNGMKDIVKVIVKENTFKLFLSDDKWNKKKTSRWKINVSLEDVKNIAKKLGVKPDVVGNKKVIDVDYSDGWKLRFRESNKKGAATDAKFTDKQEKGSAYIFNEALKRKSAWPSEDAFEKDDKLMAGLRKIYPEVDDTWILNYWKQHKTILNEFSKSNSHKFQHDGSGSFMDFISNVVKSNFGVKKKDNWNPADIWMIKGNVETVKNKIEKTVFGNKDSQTIAQLNSVLRGMYKNREVVGISLKKISGKEAKWEEYNIEKMTLDEVDDYKYKDIKLTIKLGSDMTSDSKVELRGSNAGYDFQIRQNSSGFSNLKWESTPKGARAARGGKAQVDFVVKLLEDNKQNFDKSNGSYPKTLKDFQDNVATYKDMFKRVKKEAITECSTIPQFVKNMESKFTSDPPVANSKLMQLAFFDSVVKFKDSTDRYTEFWTDMVFLSIKKGDRFGPFGKLY